MDNAMMPPAPGQGAPQPPAPQQPMPDGGMLDASDDKMVQDLIDGISNYYHGPARDHVSQSLANAGEEALVDTISAMAYQTLTQVSGQVGKADPNAVTIDLMMILAQYAIDYLIQIAGAVGVTYQGQELVVPEDEEVEVSPAVQEIREDAMFRMVEIHMAKIGDDPEQKALAEEMFAEYLEDGTFEEAADYVATRMEARGMDPSTVAPGAAKLLQPRPNQLAAGIQQGLIDQGAQR